MGWQEWTEPIVSLEKAVQQRRSGSLVAVAWSVLVVSKIQLPRVVPLDAAICRATKATGVVLATA